MRLSPIFVAATLLIGTVVVAAGPVAAAPQVAHSASAPVAAQFASFADVTCPTTASCYAFGTKTRDMSKTLVEHWDGTSWSVMATPNSAASPSTRLAGGGCSSDTSCFAVGDQADRDSCCSPPKPFAMRWDGSTWSEVPTATLPGTTSAALTSVACTSASNCFAVGSLEVNSTTKTLVERWNGTTFAYVASPTPPGESAGFDDVACPSVNRCFAVGATFAFPTLRALIETWDGTRWTITAKPGSTRGGIERLSSVTCTNATHCQAVGDEGLVWRLVGLKWVAAPSPTGPGTQRGFYGTTCTSATSCYAVGYFFQPAFSEPHTLIEHWDGLHWVWERSPNDVILENRLLGVACASQNTCFAVGDKFGDAPNSLIQRWNGTSWSSSPHPHPSF